MDLAARFHSQCADLRDKHRFARAQHALARRQGDTRRVRSFHRVIVKCLRALRFAARIEAGKAGKWVFDDSLCRPHPHCSHPIFSGGSENTCDAAPPPAAPGTNRRRTFRERLRRW
ncbi:hypothetical protein [Brevundimonas sp. GCM10030266]|uniref:hypothetical protein n=1 Tax=Brevundimonas sp. GCM10030266 TaxID=3273386 RepID=UPI003613E24E